MKLLLSFSSVFPFFVFFRQQETLSITADSILLLTTSSSLKWQTLYIFNRFFFDNENLCLAKATLMCASAHLLEEKKTGRITKSSLNQDMQGNIQQKYKKRSSNLRGWSWQFHAEVLHLYQDLFRLSRLFLDFDHRIYFSAWMNVKKGWICATFVTGNPYGTRVLGKSSQISGWARTHWSCHIGDLNGTSTCSGREGHVWLPRNCLQGFDCQGETNGDQSSSPESSSCPFISSCSFMLFPLLQMRFSPNNWFLTFPRKSLKDSWWR